MMLTWAFFTKRDPQKLATANLNVGDAAQHNVSLRDPQPRVLSSSAAREICSVAVGRRKACRKGRKVWGVTGVGRLPLYSRPNLSLTSLRSQVYSASTWSSSRGVVTTVARWPHVDDWCKLAHSGTKGTIDRVFKCCWYIPELVFSRVFSTRHATRPSPGAPSHKYIAPRSHHSFPNQCSSNDGTARFPQFRRGFDVLSPYFIMPAMASSKPFVSWSVRWRTRLTSRGEAWCSSITTTSKER